MAGATIPLSTPSLTTTISKEGASATKPALSRVLVLGGTGRVGGSVAIALSKLCPSLQIQVSGRNRSRGSALVSTLGKNSEFVRLDINNWKMLKRALEDVDLVVHCAGPFQQNEKCTVLEAAISTKTAYVDVSDDMDYALKAKGFHNEAMAAGIPALTTAGIYPGLSNVMAAELVDVARNKDKTEPERLRFFYYTAGTGGAGPAILASSLLLLGDNVIAYNKGRRVSLKPYSGGLNIDFGKGVGRKDVYLLNFPEVKSAHEILKVPTVSARFGTEPFFWNWGMLTFAELFPMETFRDKNTVGNLVNLLDPFVRSVDGIAGEVVSIRIDLDCTNGKTTTGLFTHKILLVSVGYSTAAFVLAVLEGSTQPGVWFPEEPEGVAIEARKVLLKRATRGVSNFVMHKPPFMVETNP